MFAKYLNVHGAIVCNHPWYNVLNHPNSVHHKFSLCGKALDYSYSTLMRMFGVINADSSEKPYLAFNKWGWLESIHFDEITNFQTFSTSASLVKFASVALEH
jgi:hypothetical protein